MAAKGANRWWRRRRIDKLILVLQIILAACFQLAACQQTTQNQTRSDTATIAVSDETSTSPTTLLSGEEFVDFTEAPTLLFDNASNEARAVNSTQSSQDHNKRPTFTGPTPPPTATTTSSSSPQPPLTTTATTDAGTNETETSMSADGEPIGDEEDEEDSAGRDGHDEDSSKADRAFEPPQNISQYMDYIEGLFHDLRHQITDLFEPHIPQLIRTSQMVQLSNPCSYDMLRMALALRQFEPWALKMIDSSGKVPEGIFEGSFTALGSYDQCLSTLFVSSSTAHTMSSSAPQTTTTPSTTTTTAASASSADRLPAPTQGKYCLVNVSPFMPPKPPADRVERMFQEEANRRNYTKVSHRRAIDGAARWLR